MSEFRCQSVMLENRVSCIGRILWNGEEDRSVPYLHAHLVYYKTPPGSPARKGFEVPFRGLKGLSLAPGVDPADSTDGDDDKGRYEGSEEGEIR